MNNRGGLSTGGEERRQFVIQWLREKDVEKETREQALFSMTQKTFSYTRRTYYAAIAAFIATLAGIAVALLHL